MNLLAKWIVRILSILHFHSRTGVSSICVQRTWLHYPCSLCSFLWTRNIIHSFCCITASTTCFRGRCCCSHFQLFFNLIAIQAKNNLCNTSSTQTFNFLLSTIDMKEKVLFGECVVAQFGKVNFRLYIHKYSNIYTQILEYISNFSQNRRPTANINTYVSLITQRWCIIYLLFHQMNHTIASKDPWNQTRNLHNLHTTFWPEAWTWKRVQFPKWNTVLVPNPIKGLEEQIFEVLAGSFVLLQTCVSKSVVNSLPVLRQICKRN